MGSAVSNAVDLFGEGLGEVRRGTTSTSADALSLGDKRRKQRLQADPNFRLANDAALALATNNPGFAGSAVTTLGLHDSLIMDPRRAQLAAENQAEAVRRDGEEALRLAGDRAPKEADLGGVQRQRVRRGRRGTILTEGMNLGGTGQGKTLLGY